MSVLEIGIRIPDTPEELFALIGEPLAEPDRPFELALFGVSFLVQLARRPIGIYEMPTVVGQSVRSLWPASFRGPLAPAAWELRTCRGVPIASAQEWFPTLYPGDELLCDVVLVGEA